MLCTFAFYGLNAGANPAAGWLNVKGTLYGTTEFGGEEFSSSGYGTAYTSVQAGPSSNDNFDTVPTEIIPRPA